MLPKQFNNEAAERYMKLAISVNAGIFSHYASAQTVQHLCVDYVIFVKQQPYPTLTEGLFPKTCPPIPTD